MAGLEFEMTYRLGVRGPLPSTKGSPRGERAWWEMSKATLEGKRIKARSAMSGMDWFSAGPDGFGRPDVRLPFNTDDGVMVLLHYTGLVETNTAFTKAAEEGGETRFEVELPFAVEFQAGLLGRCSCWHNKSVIQDADKNVDQASSLRNRLQTPA